MRPVPNTFELMLRFALAMLLVLGSGVCLVFAFAFSTSAGNPFPDGSLPWWRAVVARMFLSDDPGLAAWLLAGMLVVGVSFCLLNLRALRRGAASRSEPGDGGTDG